MNWSPFKLVPPEERAPAPREIHTLEGVGDRLRAAAFAELQAREAFLWAARELSTTAPEGLTDAWRSLAREEDKHLGWLLARLDELGLLPQERPVSNQLWLSFMKCTHAKDFALYMASAEERGRRAGERFYREMLQIDRRSAEIFGKIAEEEQEHIRLAERFYGANPVSRHLAGQRA